MLTYDNTSIEYGAVIYKSMSCLLVTKCLKNIGQANEQDVYFQKDTRQKAFAIREDSPVTSATGVIFLVDKIRKKTTLNMSRLLI